MNPACAICIIGGMVAGGAVAADAAGMGDVAAATLAGVVMGAGVATGAVMVAGEGVGTPGMVGISGGIETAGAAVVGVDTALLPQAASSAPLAESAAADTVRRTKVRR